MRKVICKPIKGYETLYKICEIGVVVNIQTGRNLKPALDGRGYLGVVLYKNTKPKTHRIHRLVAEAFLDKKPKGRELIVDHIDNDPLNNKVENLQIITTRENSSKDKKDGTSRYIGVSFRKKRNNWIARTRINGKEKYLGSFDNEIDAAGAYHNELKKIDNEK